MTIWSTWPLDNLDDLATWMVAWPTWIFERLVDLIVLTTVPCHEHEARKVSKQSTWTDWRLMCLDILATWVRD